MEASAVQTPIYLKFRQIGAGAPDLFERSLTVVEKQYNIGNINSGAVAIDGSTAVNHGHDQRPGVVAAAGRSGAGRACEVEAALHAATGLPDDKRREALSHVEDAKANPSPSKIGKVVETIGHLGRLAEAGKALAPYASALGTLVGLG